jgi:hypothetical protein
MSSEKESQGKSVYSINAGYGGVRQRNRMAKIMDGASAHDCREHEVSMSFALTVFAQTQRLKVLHCRSYRCEAQATDE